MEKRDMYKKVHSVHSASKKQPPEIVITAKPGGISQFVRGLVMIFFSRAAISSGDSRKPL